MMRDINVEHSSCDRLDQRLIDWFGRQGVPALTLGCPWPLARDQVVFEGERDSSSPVISEGHVMISRRRSVSALRPILITMRRS